MPEQKVMNWLLNTDDPDMRYLALRGLAEADSQSLTIARRKAHNEGPIAQVKKEPNKWATLRGES